MIKAIRKFGLEYCDLPTMLWNISTLLRVVISLGISGEIGTSKLIYMFLNKKRVRDLVEGYLLCDSTLVLGSRFQRHIQKTLRIVKKRALLLSWIVVMSNGVVYCVTVSSSRTTPDGRLAYYLWYEVEPMYESPNFEIAYWVTLFGALFTVYLPANITAFFIIVTSYTEAQILALSQEIKYMWKVAKDLYNKNNINDTLIESEYKNKIINEYIKSTLTEIAKRHMTNINLIGQVEDAFRGAILLEFLLFVLGLIAELLV